MALSRDRILADGQTPHPWERQAVDFIKSVLPDNEPYALWGLVEIVEPSGRRHEVDALVMGYNALYLVEIKSHPARFSGNAVDWQYTFLDKGTTHVMENPITGAGRKARILAGLLDRDPRFDRGGHVRRPRVEPLVFLSDPMADVSGLDTAGRNGVVTRAEFLRAITHGEFPGAYPSLRDRAINTPTQKATVLALARVGVMASKGALKLGDLRFEEIIDEGLGYQDHRAVHESLGGERRVRVYLVPQSTTAERRDQLRRAATREARILSALSHPHVLRCQDFKAEGPTGGPCLVFEHDPEFQRLDVYLRKRPGLSFTDRIAILQQVGDAVAYCHHREVFHRAIDPTSVLVKGGDGTPIDVRLFNFQLAMHADTRGTVHLSALSEMAVYRAPEVVEDPEKATAASDVFSLGALAYFVFVGRAPATSLVERQALLERQGRLSIAAASDAAGVQLRGDDGATRKDSDGTVRHYRHLDEVIGFATERKLLERCDSVADLVDLLGHAGEDDRDGDVRPPSEAVSGDVLEADDKTELLVEKTLGTGSTARVFRVSIHTTLGTQTYALKVALEPSLDERLEAEAALLERARGDRIVALVRKLTFHKRVGLLLQDAGTTLAELPPQERSVSLDEAQSWGEDLLLAVDRLEELRIVHKDIKPANLGVSDPDQKRAKHLRLFDFSLASAPEREVNVGTPAYRDPFLHHRGVWDTAADRFSVALVLYEMLTGRLPRWGGEDIAVTTDAEASVEAERFDPTVRDALAGFFQKALARAVHSRFDTAQSMRKAWNAVFLQRALQPVAQAVASAESAPPEATPSKVRKGPPMWSVAELRAVSDSTPVAALPVSNRALNALDRAGLLTFGDVRKSSKAKLDALQGIGRETSREILAFRDQWRKADAASEPASTTAPTTAPDAASGEATPATLGALVNALVPEASKAVRGKKWIDVVRTMFGLNGGAPVDGADLAQQRGVTRQAVFIQIYQAREHWAQHRDLPALHARVHDLLEARGGIGSMESLAEDLARALGASATEALAPQDRVRALALAEIARQTDESLSDAVLQGRRWIATERGLLGVLRTLGETADRLGARAVLPSAEEARTQLTPALESTSLARLPVERLLPLAAEASTGTACSARLELYPRGMSAARALRLCGGVFTEGTWDEARLRAIVTSRYAQAEELPPRPALDDLVKTELGFAWDPTNGSYARERSSTPDTSRTLAPVVARPSVVARIVPATSSTRALPFGDESARDFDDRLRVAAQKGSFRVLNVAAVHAPSTAMAVARRLDTTAHSLDAALWKALLELAVRDGVDREAIVAADRAGPGGEDWETLRGFVKDAAREVLARWATTTEGKPLVVRDLGLAARYGLRELVDGLAEIARRDDGPAVFVVLARYGDQGDAPIDGGMLPSLPVPNPNGTPRMVPPASWLRELTG